MANVTEKVKRFSFEGYDLLVWFSENKDSLKYILTATIGLSTVDWKLAGIAGSISIVCKYIIDAIDYWQKDKSK